jgi:hypothetical protein
MAKRPASNPAAVTVVLVTSSIVFDGTEPRSGYQIETSAPARRAKATKISHATSRPASRQTMSVGTKRGRCGECRPSGCRVSP